MCEQHKSISELWLADKDRCLPVCLEDFVVGRVLGHNIDVVLEQNLGAALKVTDQLPHPGRAAGPVPFHIRYARTSLYVPKSNCPAKLLIK